MTMRVDSKKLFQKDFKTSFNFLQFLKDFKDLTGALKTL